MTTQAAPDAAIVAKIRKILSRTEEAGCSQAEAEAAFKLASKLMMDHSITMDSVEGAAVEADHWVKLEVGTTPTWQKQQSYASAIVKDFFFVESILLQGHDDKGRKFWKYTLFGRPDNVETARFVFSSLMRSFYTLFEDYQAATGCKKSEYGMFSIGVASGFRDKLTEERKADQMERDLLNGKSGGTEIVLASMKEKLMAAYRQEFGKTTKVGTRAPRGSASSLDAGYAAGRKLNLSRQIGGKGQGKLTR